MLINGEYSTARAARSLGWASVGIGLAELLAPGQVEQLLGLDHKPSQQGILQTLGVRELLHGFSILTERDLNPQLRAGVWSRVAGDILDSALLGVAAAKTRRPSSFAAVAAAVAAIGALDLIYAVKVHRRQR
jgi:hypothetical protein